MQHRLDHQAGAGLESVDAGIERRPRLKSPTCVVTSASVSGRRNARCPNAVMKALPLPAVSVGAFAGTRRASAVASPVTLSASFSEASNSCGAELLGHVQIVRFIVEADQRVARDAAVDVRDVRQLQQVTDGVRPLRPAEPRHP